ncbi:tRNA lysidine(34) synthetase TilS [Anaerofilum sp. BX8]|uniref:tRNA(Ile)-lysidine synthase n=1 Tax=Anaerofilum hominis TaxID=2763016 RepID=A0A923KYG7_9FIRM|nr:tRNA lysidine(34) synthetase TilS [Anaerofilum hominis]MBC5581994.1 tRNA lysidine(34) synthetase TilS [Anaerofilum hominis]
MTDIEKLEKKAARFIAEQALLQSGDTVLCALSGGPDSVALFHVLRSLAPALGIGLQAVHLNHGLRGAEADRDEAFVRELCARWSVPLWAERAEMAQRPRPAGQSEETFARALRYDFFERAAEAAQALSGGPVKVATAHTASDNAETLLFRLARGTSLTGAGGIPPRRGGYIRPLLCCTRQEILAYCRSAGHAYRTDSTNLLPCCSRNRLRLQAMPVLRGVNPKAEEALSAFAEDARETAAFLDGLARQLLAAAAAGAGWRAGQLAAAPGPVRRAALAQLLAARDVTGREQVTEAAAVVCGEKASSQLGEGLFARRSGGIFYLEQTAPAPPADWELPFSTGLLPLPDGRIVAVLEQEYEEIVKLCGEDKKELKKFADYGMINKISTFRTRRPGDLFRPAGRGVTKSLKKLMAEDGVPRSARGRLLVLAEGRKVLWLEGVGVCEELLPRPGCRRAVQIKLIEPEE